MKTSTAGRSWIAAIFMAMSYAPACAAENNAESRIRAAVDAALAPVLQMHDIPGMAIAITVRGQSYYYNYGIASRESAQAVTPDTLFEIGSVSKTFTGLLASYAEALGALSLSDRASRHWTVLRGSAFDNISLLELGTYTAGGLPLQFPEEVNAQESMLGYYRNWQPAYPAGSHRLYSNPSIGLFGFLAARSLGKPYRDLMENTLFPSLGLANTYVQVPPEKMGRYAWGHTKTNAPVRVNPGLLDAEAYGVKSSAADMLRFMQLNMDPADLERPLRQAIARSQTGYFRVDGMTQGLGWELYPYPVRLETLIEASLPRFVLEAGKATRLPPTRSTREAVFIHKTGSTNGFGAYLAFIPAKGMGIVMLANKNYPNVARIEAAAKVLKALEEEL